MGVSAHEIAEWEAGKAELFIIREDGRCNESGKDEYLKSCTFIRDNESKPHGLCAASGDFSEPAEIEWTENPAKAKRLTLAEASCAECCLNDERQDNCPVEIFPADGSIAFTPPFRGAGTVIDDEDVVRGWTAVPVDKESLEQ